jgi:predicted nucleic acid-binding protein
MIYADTSALTKLVISEQHTESMLAISAGTMVSSELAITELRRAVRHHAPDRMVVAERLLSEITTIAISRDILRLAGSLDPATMRSLDAIHLATAILVRDDIDALVAYDERLLSAARLAGIPTASPGL